MSKKKYKPTEITPDVDVVIPVYSNYEILPKVLDALKRAFDTVSYRVWFTDDYSPDLTSVGKDAWNKIKAQYPEVANVLIHGQNMGYPKSVNDSAVMGKAKHILILNSDVLLMDFAGKFMHERLLTFEDTAIVFPKLIFFPTSTGPQRPAGKIQHAGMVFDINGMPYHIHLGWNPDHPFVNSIKNFNACTGAAFMIKREMWRKLGGYDLIFGRGTFEDTDLCIRVRLTGNKITYLPMCVGFHYTGASSEKTKTGFPLERNYHLFLEKHKDNIPYDEFQFAAD